MQVDQDDDGTHDRDTGFLKLAALFGIRPRLYTYTAPKTTGNVVVVVVLVGFSPEVLDSSDPEEGTGTGTGARGARVGPLADTSGTPRSGMRSRGTASGRRG